MEVAGPLVAAALVALAEPALALVVAGGLVLVGGLAFASTAVSREWSGEASQRSWLGPLAAPGMRLLVLASVPAGAVIGVLEIAAPAFADERGSGASGGIALAALAAGALIGALVYGSRTWPGSLPWQYTALLAAFAVLLIPAQLTDSIVALAPLLFLGGLAMGPVTATQFGLIDHVAPPGTATEALTWIIIAFTAGVALGTVAGGLMHEAYDAQAALALASVAAMLELLVVVVGRARLSEPPSRRTPGAPC